MANLSSMIELLWSEEYNKVELSLLDRSFFINQKDENGRTLLHLLLMRMMTKRKIRLDAMRFLITSGADVNIRDESEPQAITTSPLHLALKLSDPDLLQIVLDSSSFDINKYNSGLGSGLPSFVAYSDVPSPDLADRWNDVTPQWKSPQEKCLTSVNGDLPALLRDVLAGPCTHSIRDVIIIKTSSSPALLSEIVSRLEPKVLSNLYLVGGPPITDEAQLDIALSSLQLQSLVMTELHLTKIPGSVFDMKLTLRVLKLSGNRISRIPESIGCLKNLRILCLDRQRPKINFIPKSFSSLSELQVLSLSGNGLEDVDSVVDLKNLQELRLDRNRIYRLPSSIVSLTSLISLDISYNRFQTIPSCYSQIIKKLRSFEYFSVSLRPLGVREDVSSLVDHLELQAFLSELSQSTNSGVKDVVVGVMGASNSGKKTLVSALKDDRGICRIDGEFRCDDEDSRNSFTSGSFDFPDESGQFHHVTMVTVDVDFIDFHAKDLQLDVILLTLDLTSFEIQNGSQHFHAVGQIAGTGQWLECISEVFPNTPVILVGTKSELIARPSTFSVSLRMLEDLMDGGRSEHSKRYSGRTCSTCFLCSSRSIFSRCLKVKSSSKFSCIDFSLTSTYGMIASPCVAADFSDSSAFDGPLSPLAPHETPSCERAAVGFPHVIGYYEIDSRKCFPKENKKHNSSVELLRKAILRHFASDNCIYSLDGKMNLIPDTWSSIVKQFSSVHSSFPLVPYDQIVAICRGFDVPYWQIPLLLRYCQGRGRFVVITDCQRNSIKFVVTNPNWLFQTGYKVLQKLEGVVARDDTIVAILKNAVCPSGDASVVKLSRDILMGLRAINFVSEMPESSYYIPKLSKRGEPCGSVWSSVPDWDEKQITCELEIRRLASHLFKDLISHILSFRGKEMLAVQHKPTPLVLNDHVVFFVAFDAEFCEDCSVAKRSQKAACIQRLNGMSPSIFHKVRISSDSKQTSFRVYVRGTTPCCVMKSVLQFVYLHLDDSEEGIHSMKSQRNFLMKSRHNAKPKVPFDMKNFHGLCGCCKVPKCQSDDFLPQDADDQESRHYILCPKCVLSKRFDPRPIFTRGLSLKRKPLCDYWHHFGSWERAATGNYKSNPAELYFYKSFINGFIPDNETPRLALLLSATSKVCRRDWMSQCKGRFMEGFEVHFLCENMTHWHIIENSGYRIIRARNVLKGPDASVLASILSLALVFIQIIHGCNEFPCNAKLLLPVVKNFAEMPEYQRFFEGEDLMNVNSHGRAYDYYCWLLRNKERIVSSLSKILAITGDGIPDLFFKNTVSVCAEKLFQVPTTGSRAQLANFLQVDLTSGTFGELRPVYLGRELRWVCQEHYEQMLSL